jgi:hypothetical protein
LLSIAPANGRWIDGPTSTSRSRSTALRRAGKVSAAQVGAPGAVAPVDGGSPNDGPSLRATTAPASPGTAATGWIIFDPHALANSARATAWRVCMKLLRGIKG